VAKALTPGIFYTNSRALSTIFCTEFGTKLCFFGLLREDLTMLLARMTSFGLSEVAGNVDCRINCSTAGTAPVYKFTGQPVGSALRIVVQFEYPEPRAF
jgi:hypothetical protein